MSLLKNAKKIIKICNIVCIALMSVIILFQFVPFLYSVDGIILSKDEYNLLTAGELILPSWSHYVDSKVERVSIVSGGLELWVGVLLAGALGIVVSARNLKSTLSGVLSLLCAYIAIGEAIQLTMIGDLFGIVSILLAFSALVLCVLHIVKIVTWCTVVEKKYYSYWK